MKILIINGSPRKNGNTSFLCESAMRILDYHNVEISYINLRNMKFEACIACGYCDRTGKCFMQDDMQPVYKQIDESDATVVITPVFFDGVPARLKGFVDRTQSIYASKYILKKPSIDRYKKRFGLLVSLGGSPPYETQFTGNKVTMEFYFKCVNTKLTEHMMVSDVDNLPVQNRPEFLSDFENELITMLDKIKYSMS